MPLTGLRSISLESRRSKDMESLIAREGSTVWLAPSVREQAADDAGAPALRFVEQLEQGEFDTLIAMTGVGLAFLRDTVTRAIPLERLVEALRKVSVVARGPKPVAVLKQLGVPIDVVVPEPNTWRELVAAVAGRPLGRVALQEYGRPNPELTQALQAQGAVVTPIVLYRWEFPEDLAPLQEAVRRLAARQADLIFFTSSIQLDHLFAVARDLALEADVRSALHRHTAIASIGPVMTETLTEQGFPPDIVPPHPKMWSLIKAASEQAEAALAGKRRVP